LDALKIFTANFPSRQDNLLALERTQVGVTDLSQELHNDFLLGPML
jgi:hypothetical protein